MLNLLPFVDSPTMSSTRKKMTSMTSRIVILAERDRPMFEWELFLSIRRMRWQKETRKEGSGAATGIYNKQIIMSACDLPSADILLTGSGHFLDVIIVNSTSLRTCRNKKHHVWCTFYGSCTCSITSCAFSCNCSTPTNLRVHSTVNGKSRRYRSWDSSHDGPTGWHGMCQHILGAFWKS